jgi:hypothetical protein
VVGNGLFLEHSGAASDLLLSDLRSDKGMDWVAEKAWLTKLIVSSPTADLKYDLAVDPTGTRQPSRVAAGLDVPVGLPATGGTDSSDAASIAGWAALAAAILTVCAAMLAPRFGRGR